MIFADEPTGNLDTQTTLDVMDMMQRFARTYNQTIVLVTHDPELKSYVDRVVDLRDGKIISNTLTGEHRS